MALFNHNGAETAVSPPRPLDLQLLHHRISEQAARWGVVNNADAMRDRALLGTGLDTVATIAFQVMTKNGIQVDAEKVGRMKAAAEKAFAESSQTIRTEGHLQAGFEWCPKQTTMILRDKNGYPKTRKSVLRRRLQTLANQSADYSATGRLPPLDDGGQISVIPSHWRQWCHPAIEAWSQLDAAAGVLRALNAGTTVNLRFTAIPQILPIGLDFSGFRRLVLKPFRARDGHKFAVVTLKGLDLRCFAHVLNRYCPSEASLGDMYRRGQDPVKETAPSLWIAEQQHPDDLHSDDFIALSRPEQRKWEMIAEVLLQSVAWGYSSQETRWALRAKMPSEDFNERFIQRLQTNLLNKWHEFTNYLDEHLTIKVVAKKTNRSMTDLIKEYPSGEHPETLARTVEIMRFDATTLSRSFTGLIAYSTGWVPRSQPTRVPAAECRELEDEIRISILYMLVQSGWQVVAFDGDDFVIELQTDRATADVRNWIQQACAQALSVFGPNAMFDCSCEFADRW